MLHKVVLFTDPSIARDMFWLEVTEQSACFVSTAEVIVGTL